MSRAVAGSTLLCAAIVCAVPLLAQQVRDTAPPPQGTGRIAGTVVNAESGRPVRMAKVVIEGGTSFGAEGLTTDSGTFEFDRLRPGSYSIQVTKPGYLDTHYGQARPGTSTPGKRIVIADREQFDRLVIPLSQGGSIAGTIRDDHGDPVFRVNVKVSRWLMRNGIRSLDAVDSTVTDERGRYHISLLPARDYVVSAIPDEEDGLEKTPIRAFQGFAPVFYPGAPSSRSATTISLGAGEDRADIDFQLPLVMLGLVTGALVTADGKPAPNFPVSLFDLDHEDLEQGTMTDGNGRFRFERVVPGTYGVSAGKSRMRHFAFAAKKLLVGGDVSVILEKKTRARVAGVVLADQWEAVEAEINPKATAAGSASGEVTVTGSTTSDIVLTLEPPRTVAGRIVVEGSRPAPALRGTVVELIARSLSGDQREAKVADDGTFVIQGVSPGKYTVTFAGEAPPWNLASAMSHGVDALDFFLEVPRDRDVRDLVLSMRDKSSELSGAVTDAASKPVADRIVIAFPSDERLWAAGERRIHSMSLAADGRYAFADVRPGMYLVALTDNVEPEEVLDPEFLKKLLTAAVPVTIAEGEKRVQDLRIR